MKNWIIAALAVALALSIAGGVVAQTQRTATVQVRLWESVEDPSVHYLSSRPEGGSWGATERLQPLTEGFVEAGAYSYGDVFVNATVPEALPAGVELYGMLCEPRGYANYVTLTGWLRNRTNAAIDRITVTAALINEEGVEVIRAYDVVLHEVGVGGTRTLRINFFGAPHVPGTCSIVSVEYEATVRHEVPVP